MSKVVCKLNQLISLDFHPDKLIVRLPTFGHEIMSDLLVAMTKSDTSYPEDYGGSSIMTGGNTNIPYDSGGFKVSRTVTRGLYFHFLYFYLSRVLLQSVM
jgi:hypothetical protein